MANFKADLISALAENKETESDIQAVWVSGPLGASYTGEDPRNKDIRYETYLPYSAISARLDYEYDDGYGGQDCHDIIVWTGNFVYSIHEYDGATWFISVPRNPGELQS